MSKYGLIGKNISYSQSPFLHKIIGDYEYDLINVQDKEELKAVLADTSYDGFNVTIPYKETVLPMLDELSDKARQVHAVNCIKRMPNGMLIGFNTDVHGFKESVGDRVNGRKCMIFGTGGAAKAAAVGLADAGAREIIFVSRTLEALRTNMPEGIQIISYNELDKHCDTQVIINATPVGGLDTIDKSVLSETGNSVRVFAALELAMDMVYNPYRTKFLQDARRLTGCKTASGLEMLIHQAIGSRNIWKSSNNISLFEKVATSAIKRKMLARQLNIVAIGMPGSGKTTIFRRYAHELKLKFIDIDQMTEELMGDTIENVLAEGGKGEEYFRQIEHQAVLEASKNNRAVIATGGGSILNPVNRDLLKSNGIVVYMKRPLNMLATKGRPISQETGVEELYNQRDSIYRRVADISIPNNETFGTSVDKKGGKNSYGYDMKVFVFHVKAIIEKYIFDIAGNKWV
ncbi:MAG: hypothetical protein KBS56_00590 [Clostridiales bacterium]|nr:hypothetical protein [Candidatus Crickella equi]